MPLQIMEMGPGVLQIGETGTLTDFAVQVTSATLSPEVDNGDPIYVLSGDTAPGDRSESWTLTGTLQQDFGHANSVQEFCFTNRGKTLPFKFTPNKALKKTISGRLTVEAVEIGGDVRTKPTTDFEFALSGEPKIEAASGEG